LQISLPKMFHTIPQKLLSCSESGSCESLWRASNLSVKPESQPPKHGCGPWRTKGHGHPHLW
jgi:hypothetical protein